MVQGTSGGAGNGIDRTAETLNAGSLGARVSIRTPGHRRYEYLSELRWRIFMFPLAHLGIPLIPLRFGGGRFTDIRLLFLGSMLPDLIDKPLGHLVLSLDNGRIFAHTLLFAVLLMALSLRFTVLMPISYGVSMHLLLDGMFTGPGTLLWPLLGGFPQLEFSVGSWFAALARPEVMVPEAVGACAIILTLVRSKALRRDGLKRVLLHGHPRGR